MAAAPQFVRLQSASHPDFAAFYAIYVESIAQRERKSQDWISSMLASPDYATILLKDEGCVAGLSILFLPRSDAFGLLEYMAVAAWGRNRGWGNELFRHSVQAAAQQRGRPLPLLLEVDSDREDSADRALRVRRQQFYRRLGCLRVANLAYVLPLPGPTPPPEMDLFVYPAGELATLRKADLERWLKLVYQDVYNCSPQDPRIGRMLQAVSDPVKLE